MHADTEISTNVQFNAERSDAREFGVEMSFRDIYNEVALDGVVIMEGSQ